MNNEYVSNVTIDLTPRLHTPIYKRSVRSLRAEEEFRAIIIENEGIPIGPWNGSRYPYHFICKRGHDCYPLPKTALNDGYGICATCARIHAINTVMDESFSQILNYLELLGANWGGDSWNGMNHSYLVYCANNHTCYPWASNISRGYGICSICKWEYQNIFYLVQSDTGIKLGITSNNPTNRLNIHKRNGYNNVLKLITNMSIMHAAMLEQKCLKALKIQGINPIKGREYFTLDALPIILQIVTDYENEVS